MKKVVVIGGGITGLSTMYYLQQLKRSMHLDMKLSLIEANPKLGGKISSHKSGEFIMETGADSIVARKEGVSELLDDLKLHDEIVHNSTGKSYIYHHNELKSIPDDTVFGIPMSEEAIFNSELISEEGKKEVLKDFTTENTTFTKDSPVGVFLEAFLGKEIVENQIAPVLSGVYSGKLNELTLETTLPYLLDYKNEYGSIIRGLSENKEHFRANGNKKFISFQNGLSTLIDRMEAELSDVEILKGVMATAIVKKLDRYEIEFTNHERMEADYVVLSVPNTVANSLLKNAKLTPLFEELVNSSLISIYLGFDIPDDRLPADGTGFIAPENSDVVCNACTWTSRKWEHTSESHNLLLRLFYKNTDAEQFNKLNSMSEEELLQVALMDVEKSLGITGKPVSVEVTKWHENMPKYHLNHARIIEALNNELEGEYPNIILAGCSYYGVGIADCIVNGKNTAKKIVEAE